MLKTILLTTLLMSLSIEPALSDLRTRSKVENTIRYLKAELNRNKHNYKTNCKGQIQKRNMICRKYKDKIRILKSQINKYQIALKSNKPYFEISGNDMNKSITPKDAR